MCIKKCVICGEILDESNKSIEHIIPNAICGHLESYKIYCKNCNNKFGDKLDKEFTPIFTAIVSQLNANKTRKTKGTSYKGVICDTNNNKYLATFKNNKLVVYRDFNNKYVGNNKIDFKTLNYNFELDNNAFKKGFAKIAFNYAIDIGLEPYELEKVFDNNRKQFLEDLIIIPFYPLTLLDNNIESSPYEKLFHVVRIFNIENYLFAYIELFNTFQHYVLLSEKYDFKLKGNIDKSVGNIIESKETIDENLLNILTPKNYKEALIVAQDYNLDIEIIIENLKRLNDYDSKENTEKMKLFLSQIGKEAFNKKNKESYIKDYGNLINKQFLSVINNYINKNILKNNKQLNELIELNEAIKYYFYIDENDKKEKIKIENYKKYLPNGLAYPFEIAKLLYNNEIEKIKHYCHLKFHKLENYINLKKINK